MKRGLAELLGFLLLLFSAAVQPALPPAPAEYVTDQAGMLSPATVARLNQKLDEFERDFSSQVVVWIESKLPPGTTLEDYVNRLLQAWEIGQKGRDNGVLLAIFPEDRRWRIETGYGVEGALPDALAGRIIDHEIRPRFRNGDYDAGVEAGVDAILAVLRGEYRGTGRTQAEPGLPDRSGLGALLGGVLGFLAGAVVRRGLFRSAAPVTQVGQAIWGGFVGGVGHAIGGSLVAARLLLPAALIVFLTWMFLVVRRRGEEVTRNGRRPHYGGWMPRGWDAGRWGGGFGGLGSGGGFGGGFRGGGGRSGGGGASGGW